MGSYTPHPEDLDVPDATPDAGSAGSSNLTPHAVPACPVKFEEPLSFVVAQKLVAFVAKENADDLFQMNELVAAGKVTPVLGPTFPLADGAAAITAFEKGDTAGRVVIST
jgi:NADPH:quinone reductase-like Zn-dependent oxidoreductase